MCITISHYVPQAVLSFRSAIADFGLLGLYFWGQGSLFHDKVGLYLVSIFTFGGL